MAESLAERLSSSNSASTSAAVPDVNFTAPQLAFLSRKGLHDSRGAVMLKNLTYLELEDWCESNGERRQRARQLWRWLYADGALIRHIDEATGVANGFSSAFLCAACPATLYLSSHLDCCYTCKETSAGLSQAALPLLAPVGRSCTATLDPSVMCLSSCKPLPLVSSPLRTCCMSQQRYWTACRAGRDGQPCQWLLRSRKRLFVVLHQHQHQHNVFYSGDVFGSVHRHTCAGLRPGNGSSAE